MFFQRQKMPASSQSNTMEEIASSDGLAYWAARSYWIFMVGAFLLAVGNGVANTWDGAYLLFRAINDGTPFVPHERIAETVLQWPAIGLSHLTSDMTLLRVAYSTTYAAVPLLSLAVCWWVTSRRTFHLFVWPAIGIGLATLPGQINLAAEANIPAQLFWPVLLAIVIGVNRWQLVVVVLLSLFILLSHPFAVLVFGFGTVTGAIVLCVTKRRSVADVGPVAVVTVFFLVSLVRFILLRTTYDSDQVTMSILGPHFSQAIAGRPFIMLLLALMVCGIVLATAHLKYRLLHRSLERRHSGTLVVVCCIILTIVGLSWAMDYRAWGGGSDFRTFIAPISLVVMAFAVVDALAITRAPDALDSIDRRMRAVTILASAGVFAAVFVVQTVTWSTLTDRLRGEMARSPTSCVALSSLPWTDATEFGHWSVTPLSLLLQGRAPRKVVITQATCDQAQLQRGIPVSTFDRIGYSGGWFALEGLRDALVLSRPQPAVQRVVAATMPSDLGSGAPLQN